MIRYCRSDKSTDIDEYNPCRNIKIPVHFPKTLCKHNLGACMTVCHNRLPWTVRDHVIQSKKNYLSDTLKSSKFKVKNSTL